MSQLNVLWSILQDKKPHSNFELVGKAYNQTGPSVARIGARIFDLKKKYGVQIDGWHDPKDQRKYWYQLKRVKIIS